MRQVNNTSFAKFSGGSWTIEHRGVVGYSNAKCGWRYCSRGGATDFKVGGYKTRFVSGASEKKILYPPLFQMWGYKQANISRRPVEYIEICCLVFALINIGRPTEWHGQPIYCCVSMLACRFDNAAVQWGEPWKHDPTSKPSFQISLT